MNYEEMWNDLKSRIQKAIEVFRDDIEKDFFSELYLPSSTIILIKEAKIGMLEDVLRNMEHHENRGVKK